MMDIMYFGDDYDTDSNKNQKDFISEMTEKFPDAKLVDAYDSIKGLRQEVHLDDDKKDSYYSYIIAYGWAMLSLTLQIAMRDKTEEGQMNDWLTQAKKEYPGNFKSKNEDQG